MTLDTIKRLPYGAIALATGLLAVMSVSAACAAPTFNTPSDVKTITDIENDINTQTSMKTLIHYYAPNATVVDIYAPGLYKGHDQIYPAFERQLAAVKTMSHRMDEINIASDGTFACAAMRIHFNTTLKNGMSIAIGVRQIDAFRKIGNEWKIIQQHVSMPVDAKTGMAVMDGTAPPRGLIDWVHDPIPGPAVSTEQAKTEIRKWMDVGALSTNINQLVGYYGPGNDMLVYDSFYPGEIRGLGELRTYYSAMMDGYSSIDVKMPEFTTDSDGSFGVQIDTQDMRLRMKDGTTKYISLRQSDCMRRVNGKWYSFFEMVSFPIDAKTGKAIMENPGAFQ